jgi:hypothetical protein
MAFAAQKNRVKKGCPYRKSNSANVLQLEYAKKPHALISKYLLASAPALASSMFSPAQNELPMLPLTCQLLRLGDLRRLFRVTTARRSLFLQ